MLVILSCIAFGVTYAVQRCVFDDRRVIWPFCAAVIAGLVGSTALGAYKAWRGDAIRDEVRETRNVAADGVYALGAGKELLWAWKVLRAVLRVVMERGGQLSVEETAELQRFFTAFEKHFVARTHGEIMDTVHEQDILACEREKVGEEVYMRYMRPGNAYQPRFSQDLRPCRAEDSQNSGATPCYCPLCQCIADALRELPPVDPLLERALRRMYLPAATLDVILLPSPKCNASAAFIRNVERLGENLGRLSHSLRLSRLLNPVVDNACARLAWVGGMGDAQEEIEDCLKVVRQAPDKTIALRKLCDTVDFHLNTLGLARRMEELPANIRAARWYTTIWLIGSELLRIPSFALVVWLAVWVYGTRGRHWAAQAGLTAALLVVTLLLGLLSATAVASFVDWCRGCEFGGCVIRDAFTFSFLSAVLFSACPDFRALLCLDGVSHWS
ncbi:hypothetical protein BD626DRAFT_237540 [Schizophyllum amplum]|uniref:Uncharacterized protein n=1 Tax=Schizophyllum amplum TaxID=97359 RepID=A0A550CJE2_9AGAR|nr:hypothetical protein BD626DRAFT_237540 [Auriculariopsis ampla]